MSWLKHPGGHIKGAGILLVSFSQREVPGNHSTRERDRLHILICTARQRAEDLR